MARVILSILSTISLLGQTQPDFSGHWLLVDLEPSAPDVPKSLSVQQTIVRTNVRGEPIEPFYDTITITRQFESGPRSQTHKIGVIGGIVPGRRPDGSLNGPTENFRVKWDGDVLILETSTSIGHPRQPEHRVERRELWSLDPNRRLRVVTTTRSSGSPPATVTSVYRRS
jgi:hypothetical protein